MVAGRRCWRTTTPLGHGIEEDGNGTNASLHAVAVVRKRDSDDGLDVVKVAAGRCCCCCHAATAVHWKDASEGYGYSYGKLYCQEVKCTSVFKTSPVSKICIRASLVKVEYKVVRKIKRW